MAIEIPPEVNLVALGFTANYFKRPRCDHFTVSINNSHDHWNFLPDLIVAMDDFARDEIDHPKYVETIVDAGCPVITTQHREKWPTTEAYPLKEVIAFLGLPPDIACKILSNSVNFALAYIAMYGAKHIHFFGLDFTAPDSPGIVQRQKNFLDTNKWPDWTIYYMEALIRSPGEPGLDGLCWLIGFLHANGVKMNFPVSGMISTTLFDLDRPNFFYGYQEQPDV